MSFIRALPPDDIDDVARHVGEAWEQLRNRRILITGGTGFFGAWLVESFCAANQKLDLGARAIVVSRDPAAFARRAPHVAADTAVTLIAGDVRTLDAATVSASLNERMTSLDFVIHAATDASAKLNSEDPLRMLDTVVQGTRNVLQLAVETGARRVLLTSSGAVYGRQPASLERTPETFSGAPDSTDANSAYGEGKRLAETQCACFHQAYGLEPLIARCFAFVGPRLPLDTHFAIGNFIADALAVRPMHISGDGTAVRSYLYASDLAIWLWTILFRGQPVRPYNVGSAEGLSIAQLAGAVTAALESGAPVIVAGERQAAAVHRYVPDVSRAVTELGLEQRVSLELAIQKTAAWYRSPSS